MIFDSAENLLNTAIERVQHNRTIFRNQSPNQSPNQSANQSANQSPNQFPNAGDGKCYELRENNNWVAGFWPGMVWLAYQQTGDPVLRDYAASLLPSFERRLDENIHITHDLGFLFTLSARAQYQLTGDEVAEALALRAAQRLLGRYRPNGRYIQAWGAVGDPVKGGQIIMDTMMNLPFLFWAGDHSGDQRYTNAALDHARATATHLMRPDGSTFHTFFFDQESGEPLRAETHQGAADESLWARGQAWGIAGFAIAAEWLPDETFLLDTARNMAYRFMAELPDDDLPVWDMWLPEGQPDYRDSSASSIALSGLLRLVRIDPEHSAEYETYAQRLFDALVRDCWDNDPAAQGLLKHGAQHVPKGIAPDAYLIFGDYYMLEALMMMNNSDPDFWGPDKKG